MALEPLGSFALTISFLKLLSLLSLNHYFSSDNLTINEQWLKRGFRHPLRVSHRMSLLGLALIFLNDGAHDPTHPYKTLLETP